MSAAELWLVRHGESTANVAATASERAGLEGVQIDLRDADVPLSAAGEEQAGALGDWLASRDDGGRPSVAWCSSYLRARQTTSIALGRLDGELPVRVDERLRDRELGVLDLLTSHGVEARYPEEAVRRRRLGEFYYRPPGGESWADVALRIRSLVLDLERSDAPERVLVVAHDAIVLSFLYVCTGLTEARLLSFAEKNAVANASVTRLHREPGSEWWSLDAFSDAAHLTVAGAPVTLHSGAPDAQPH